jgi:hypothetical protein
MSFKINAQNFVKIDDIEQIKILNHNNVPKKILLRSSPFDGLELVKEFNAVLTKINLKYGFKKGDRGYIQLMTFGLPSDDPKLGQFHFNEEYLKKHYEAKWFQDMGEIAVAKLKGIKKKKLLILKTNKRTSFDSVIGDRLSIYWNAKIFDLSNYKLDGDRTADYGGNIEITPNDILYIGSNMSKEQKKFFSDKGYHDKMVQMNVGWLDVGHVDEIITTIIDHNNTCGFSLIKADPLLYLKLLSENIKVYNTVSENNLVFKNELIKDKNLVLKLLKMAFKDFDFSHQIKKIEKNISLSNEDKESLYLKKDIQFNHVIAKIIERNVDKIVKKIKWKNPLKCKNLKVISLPVFYSCNKEDELPDYYWLDYNDDEIQVMKKERLLKFLKEGLRPNSCSAQFQNSINMIVLRNDIITFSSGKYIDLQIKNILENENQTVHFLKSGYPYLKGGGGIHCGTNLLRLPNEYVIDLKR